MESAERPLQTLETETPLPLPPKPLPLPRIRFKLSAPPPPPRTDAAAIMETKFRHAVLKLASDNANHVPLTGHLKSLIDKSLTEFLAEFRTPDHPPYAAMIQRAIRELKEKGGSTEESISRFIRKEYTDLPWAHNTLLKHHLGNLCDDGEIIVLRKRFYLLAGANPSPRNSNGAKEKRKRKQRPRPGRMRSNRWKKDEKEEDNRGGEEDTEVVRGKYEKELEKLNECEREVEMVEEHAHVLELPIKLVEEADEQSKEVPHYKADGHQNEAIGGQSQHLTLDDGFFIEHRCENMVTQEQQENQEIKVIEEHCQQGDFRRIRNDDYLVEGENRKNSCVDEEAPDTWDLLAQQNHDHNLTAMSLTDSNMDLGQLEEEIQPKPLAPESPPGFGVAVADGLTGTRELPDIPSNLEKIEQNNTLDLVRDTISLFLPLNLEVVEQEHHEVLPNSKSSEVQLASTKELSFTLQQIKEEQRLQKQLKCKDRRNSETTEERSNPGASKEKHDQGKCIKSHGNGKMGQDLTLISSEVEKEKLEKVLNTVQESISEEQVQREELLPEPGIVIASRSLPCGQKHLDQEKLPYISDPRRPIVIKQIAVEESSQTASARMQRQLKRWDRSTLEQHDQRKKSRSGAKEVEIQEDLISLETIGEDKQAEEPISQRATKIATCDFPMGPRQLDHEAKPDVSYPRKPICLDLVSMEQEERVQQKLRCSQWRQPDGFAESMLIGDLYPLSQSQDQTVFQPELPTPERPQELKDTQDGSSQISGQRSKLRSWKRNNTLKQSGDAVVSDSGPSPLGLQTLQESKQTQQESNRTLGQQPKIPSRKRENRMEQHEVEVDEHLYAPLAFLPPLLSAPQKYAELLGKRKSHPTKEISTHWKSCHRIPKPEPTSVNVREALLSQYYHEKKQPENSGRGRHLKMKRKKSLAFITLSESTAMNLEGERPQKVPSKAKMNQNQHNLEKPAERKRGRPLKVKLEMDNSEAVLLVPAHSHCSKVEEEEPKEYRVPWEAS